MSKLIHSTICGIICLGTSYYVMDSLSFQMEIPLFTKLGVVISMTLFGILVPFVEPKIKWEKFEDDAQCVEGDVQ